MPASFIDQLNRLLANNQLGPVIDTLFENIRNYKKTHPEEAKSVEEFETQLIVLSARYKELTAKEFATQLDAKEIQIARSQLFSNLRGVLSGLGDYEGLASFLKDQDLREIEIQETSAPPSIAQAFHSAPSTSAQASAAKPSSNNTMLWVLLTVLGLAVAGVGIWKFSGQGDKKIDPKGNNTPAVSQAEVKVDPEKDKQSWEIAQRSDTKAAYELYLLNNSKGEYAQAAQKRIIEIEIDEDEKLIKAARKEDTPEAYRDYLAQSKLHRYAEEAEKRLEALMAGDDLAKELYLIQGSDTLTLVQKINLLTKGTQKLPESRQAEFKTQIEVYQEALDKYASIPSKERFVVARSVNDRMPVPREGASTLAKGGVSAWAMLNAPQSKEAVRFVWLNDQHEEVAFNIINVSRGDRYRVWDSKNLFKRPAGKYEVRLYNGQDMLIGRRVFTLK